MTTIGTPTGRYRIAEIAELSGFSPSTLRYYEQAGVLAASERTPAGYRIYSDRDLGRLRLISRAKDLGCSLDEIAELVQAWDSDECGPCDDSCGCTTTMGHRSADDDPVPVACSLSGDDMGQRIEDWRNVLGDVARRLPLPGGARLELGDRTAIADLAAVVEAEQTCCPFFSFAITLDQRGLALEVTAPTDGQDLLAAVFGDGA